MNATIDSYLQVVVSLTEEDVGTLEKRKKLEGKIWRPYDCKEMTLSIYVKDSGWRTEFLPQKEIYEIDFPPKGLDKIKQRETIGAEFPTISFRKIYISLEGVF